MTVTYDLAPRAAIAVLSLLYLWIRRSVDLPALPELEDRPSNKPNSSKTAVLFVSDNLILFKGNSKKLSSKEFSDLVEYVHNSALFENKRRNYDFITSLIARFNRHSLTADEAIAALTLFGKYITLHSHMSNGVRVNRNMPLWMLPKVINRLSGGELLARKSLF